MFNYRNLSDNDFEILCKDILEKELKIDLRTFAPGRDGGIDIRCFKSNDIIGQSKLYLKETTIQTVNKVKSEKEKIDKLSPKKYYVFVGRELTSDNIKSIFIHFKDYMDDESFIWDLIRIDDYLNKKENSDILLKHHKLWFESVEILKTLLTSSIDIQTKAKINSYLDLSKYFVKTRIYYEAISLLDQYNVVLLHGDAGVGKTTTSEMLLHLYNLKGYEIIYLTSNDYASLFEKLSYSEKKKQIILLDDFLGQRYSELREEKVTPIITLLNYILKSESKKLILNSRITVLNDAKSQYENFNSRLNSKNIQKYEINMNKLTDSEKGWIFLSNLHRFNVGEDYYENIRKMKRYKLIVMHKNFNPRAIEYVTQNYELVSQEDYFSFIMKTLNDSFKVWENEYDHKIENEDRLLILTIYTLGNKNIPEDIVVKCYNHLMSKTNLKGNYSKNLTRLEKSFITINFDNDTRYLNLKNPSIYDFLDKKLIMDYTDLITILNFSLYLEQVNTIFRIFNKSNSSIINTFEEIYALKRFDQELRLDPFIIIGNFEIKNSIYKDVILKFKNKIDGNPFAASYVKLCLHESLIDFYNIDIYTEYGDFSKVFYTADVGEYLKGLIIFQRRNPIEFLDGLVNEIKTEITNRISNYFNTHLRLYLDNYFDNYHDIPEEVEIKKDEVGNYYVDNIPKEVLDDFNNQFKEFITKKFYDDLSLTYNISLDELKKQWQECLEYYPYLDICNTVDIDNISRKYIEIYQYDMYQDYLYDQYKEEKMFETSLEDIFERVYKN